MVRPIQLVINMQKIKNKHGYNFTIVKPWLIIVRDTIISGTFLYLFNQIVLNTRSILIILAGPYYLIFISKASKGCEAR